MKTLLLCILLAGSLLIIPSCGKQQAVISAICNGFDSTACIHYEAYWERYYMTGCWTDMDDSIFPPIAIEAWKKVALMRNRFPVYAGKKNARCIYNFKEIEIFNVKAYDISLPKLAYYAGPDQRVVFETDSATGQLKAKPNVVVVTQAMRHGNDTIIGFRYITGGFGASLLRNFHILTDSAANDAVKSWIGRHDN